MKRFIIFILLSLLNLPVAFADNNRMTIINNSDEEVSVKNGGGFGPITIKDVNLPAIIPPHGRLTMVISYCCDNGIAQIHIKPELGPKSGPIGGNILLKAIFDHTNTQLNIETVTDSSGFLHFEIAPTDRLRLRTDQDVDFTLTIKK